MSSRYYKDRSTSSSRRERKKDEDFRTRAGNRKSKYNVQFLKNLIEITTLLFAPDNRSRSNSPKPPNESKSLSKQISGYSDMTPAERVRAKMKLLLDKTSSQSSITPLLVNTPIPPPDQQEISSIESDSFAPQSFVSSRKKGSAQLGSVASTHDDVIFGKTDSLQSKFPSHGGGVESSSLTAISNQYRSENDEIVTAEMSDEDLALKWIKKLVELRNRYSSPPMD